MTQRSNGNRVRFCDLKRHRPCPRALAVAASNVAEEQWPFVAPLLCELSDQPVSNELRVIGERVPMLGWLETVDAFDRVEQRVRFMLVSIVGRTPAETTG